MLSRKSFRHLRLIFFTNVSHELRTPLTLIAGPVKAIKGDEVLTEKGQRYLSIIEDNSSRMLQMVNQLLDFRKVQDKKMQLKLVALNLVDLVYNTVDKFDQLAYQKRINIVTNCKLDTIEVAGDEEKLTTVFYNLLSNAVKFTPTGGEIQVVVALSDALEKVVVSVRDNGVGISKVVEKSLFARYENAQSSVSDLPGTGIGLAYSKELVLLHGGDLNYVKNSSGGATFEVVLTTGIDKLETGSVQEEVPSKAPTLNRDTNSANGERLIYQPKKDGEGNKERVLVVEDNREMRDFLRLQLDDLYVVLEAANGVEGLEKAVKWSPDLIISDVMMPEMDGVEMLEKLKSDFNTSHIPVVLLTAKSSEESQISAFELGTDAYITKPFSMEKLRVQIHNLLRSRRRLCDFFTRGADVENAEQMFGNVTVTDEVFLNNVRAIIEENLENNTFKIELIYRKLGVGRTKFFEKIKGLTGLSPIDFVKEYRMNKAEDLLKTGKYNVSEVSYMSGYSDAGYFSRCFKERFGVSPSHYIK